MLVSRGKFSPVKSFAFVILTLAVIVAAAVPLVRSIRSHTLSPSYFDLTQKVDRLTGIVDSVEENSIKVAIPDSENIKYNYLDVFITPNTTISYLPFNSTDSVLEIITPQQIKRGHSITFITEGKDLRSFKGKSLTADRLIIKETSNLILGVVEKVNQDSLDVKIVNDKIISVKPTDTTSIVSSITLPTHPIQLSNIYRDDYVFLKTTFPIQNNDIEILPETIEVVSYTAPFTGTVTSIDDKKIVINQNSTELVASQGFTINTNKETKYTVNMVNTKQIQSGTRDDIKVGDAITIYPKPKKGEYTTIAQNIIIYHE